MLKSHRYRLYPTAEQVDYIDQTLGCCRLVYNLALGLKIDAYKQHGVKYSAFDLCKQMAEMKRDYDWLKKPDSQALQASIKKIDRAFENFYNGSGYPKFKRKNNSESFQCPNNKRSIDFEKGLLTIPKIADIPLRMSRRFFGKIKTVTIKKMASGRYYCSILVDNQQPLPQKKEVKNSVGIDLGINTFATLSDGTSYANMSFLQKSADRLAALQRKASNKKSRSNNKRKAQIRVARMHEKIANQRNDYLHKVSDAITKRYDTICIEDLNIKGMSASCKPKQDDTGKYIPNGQSAKSGLNKRILEAGWGKFVTYLTYKSEWRGNNLVKIGRFTPSSKTCCNCGYVNRALTLSDREWDCPECKAHHDRDDNAAKNIEAEGLKILQEQKSGPGRSKELAEPQNTGRKTRNRRKHEVTPIAG